MVDRMADRWLLLVYAHVNDESSRFALQHDVLACGERGPGSGPYSWEDDLFAGLGDSA
jgi:N-acetyl-1-D-myo-inositol-2-amino-2-deoxy-alpha-D-glucopyranoside deacetylase